MRGLLPEVAEAVSVKHMHQAGEQPGMDPTKKLVLMAIADDAAQDTRISYPGMEKLILWSNRSERRVSELIEELIRDGSLARKSFSYPGRRAEYIVFPTDDELAGLDDVDPRLNEARKRPPRKRRTHPGPVDNSSGMPATGRSADSDNGRDISPNGRDSYRTPPVRPTGTRDISGPVPEVGHESDGAVDGTGPHPSPTPSTVSRTFQKPLHPADVLKQVGSWFPVGFDDDMVQLLAKEILDGASARVADPTGYVIRAIRNTVRVSEQRRGRWLLRADEIHAEQTEMRRRGGF